MSGHAVSAHKAFTVTYRARARAEAEQWLTIIGVPAALGQSDVEAALQATRMWERWHARVGIGSVITVRKARPSDDAHEVIGWDALAPTERTITVRVGSALHATATRLAKSEGKSLIAFVEDALVAAVGESTVAMFVDVQLPDEDVS